MRRSSAALSGLVCALVAMATPAAAFFEIDPLTRQPLYGSAPATQDNSYRPQATAVPRQVVSFNGRTPGHK